jgi:hypothetical protein
MHLRAYRTDLAWAALAFASVASVPFLMEEIWIFAFIPSLVSLLTGIALVVYRSFSKQSQRAAAIAAFGLVLFFTSGPLHHYIGRALTYVRFTLDRDELDAIVARELRYATIPHRAVGGGHIVENGPPLRVAFPSPGGMLDNWCGVVFDPSALVMRANDFRGDFSNWDDPKLAHVKKLFGGDLRSCRHLDGAYYYCCFT